MARLETYHEEELKDIVLAYLTGKSIREIKVRLSTICDTLNINCKDLYKSISLAGASDDKYLKVILTALGLKPEDPLLLNKTSNLYDLLKYFAKNNNHHAEYIVNLIANTKAPNNWSLIFFFGTVSTVFLGITSYFNKDSIDQMLQWLRQTCPSVIEWLGKTFTLLKNLPLLGILNTSLRLLWNWYKTFANPINSTSHKISLLFFKTITAGLTITAYCLSFFAGGLMTLPAATLFVLSSSIELFKSLFIFMKNRQRFYELAKPIPESDWDTWSEYIRVDNLYNRSLDTFWIWVASAILTTVAVGVWNFFPPNLIVTLTCLTVIPLIAWTKNSLISTINEGYANTLQEALVKNIPQNKKPNMMVTQQNMINEKFHQLEVVREELEGNRGELAAESEKLKSERAIFEREQAAWRAEVEQRQLHIERQVQEIHLVERTVHRTLEAVSRGTSASKALDEFLRPTPASHSSTSRRNRHPIPFSLDFDPNLFFSTPQRTSILVSPSPTWRFDRDEPLDLPYLADSDDSDIDRDNQASIV